MLHTSILSANTFFIPLLSGYTEIILAQNFVGSSDWTPLWYGTESIVSEKIVYNFEVRKHYHQPCNNTNECGQGATLES